jgi:hypothetical protein
MDLALDDIVSVELTDEGLILTQADGRELFLDEIPNFLVTNQESNNPYRLSEKPILPRAKYEL